GSFLLHKYSIFFWSLVKVFPDSLRRETAAFIQMNGRGIAFPHLQKERGNPCFLPFHLYSFHQSASDMPSLTFFLYRDLGNLSLVQDSPHPNIPFDFFLSCGNQIDSLLFFQNLIE